jgi:hypothetical protein
VLLERLKRACFWKNACYANFGIFVLFGGTGWEMLVKNVSGWNRAFGVWYTRLLISLEKLNVQFGSTAKRPEPTMLASDHFGSEMWLAYIK